MSDTTRTVVGRARSGDSAALALLIDRERTRVIGVLRGVLGGKGACRAMLDDLEQEVRLEAIRKIESFEPRGPGSFGRWIAAIARNKALGATRGERRWRSADRLDSTGAAPLAAGCTTPASGAARAELSDRVLEALEDLSDDHREVVLLRFFEALPGDEIAVRLGRTRAATRQLLLRALRALGERLRALEDVAA